MKYLLVTLLLLTGCQLFDECQPGDAQACKCGINSYVNHCTMDNFYYDCNCYQNDGSPITTEQAQEQEDMGGTMSGGNQEDLNSWFTENTAIRTCDTGEIAIPNTNTCLRICPVGMDWVNDECQGHPWFHSYEKILEKCESYRPDYRLMNMDEVVELLDTCYPMTFSKETMNYCSSYLSSPIRNALQLPNDMLFNTWIGEPVVCNDAYGATGAYCSWEAMFYLKSDLSTEFNLLRSSNSAGSAMASGLCVRE